MNKNICVFCEKDLSSENYGDDYTLIPWRDDPEDPEPLNKIVKSVHYKCLDKLIARFLELMDS